MMSVCLARYGSLAEAATRSSKSKDAIRSGVASRHPIGVQGKAPRLACLLWRQRGYRIRSAAGARLLAQRNPGGWCFALSIRGARARQLAPPPNGTRVGALNNSAHRCRRAASWRARLPSARDPGPNQPGAGRLGQCVSLGMPKRARPNDSRRHRVHGLRLTRSHPVHSQRIFPRPSCTHCWCIVVS